MDGMMTQMNSLILLHASLKSNFQFATLIQNVEANETLPRVNRQHQCVLQTLQKVELLILSCVEREVFDGHTSITTYYHNKVIVFDNQ